MSHNGYGPERLHPFTGRSLPSLIRAACVTTPADQAMTWGELLRRLLLRRAT